MNSPVFGKIIHMRGVSWMPGDKPLLNAIDWDVGQGEHWAVLGLNGSGKTSLLNMINGYIWPSAGEMSVLGKDFGRYDVRQLRQKIGWVSSSLQETLYGTETAKEVVLSGISATIGLYNTPSANDVARASSLLAEYGCMDIAEQPYGTLSQGEKQKVLIARALVGSPDLLILDEPCAGLDIFARERLLSLIDGIGSGAHGPTLLYVSHHIEEVLPVFTHTLLLRCGKIHSRGRTKAILTSKNLSDCFGRPVRVRWTKGRAWLETGQESSNEKLMGIWYNHG